MNGAMFIAVCLRQEGVTKVFGQCGHTNYALIDACHKIGIEYVSFRHEQQAAHAADAYFRVSHKLAVLNVHLSPGLTNALTGVATAAADGTPMLVITAVSFVFFSIIALYFIFKQRGKRAAIALAASMIPAGLSMVVAVAKTAPYFSLADVARYLNPRLETGGHAMFEGPLDNSSSLIFYLNRKFFFVNQNPRKEAPIGAPATDIFLNEQAVLDKWGQPDAVYLIVEQSRADYWKQLVISRFHVYHQVTTSGTYVVLSNQL